MSKTLDIEAIRLDRGSHDNPDEGHCVMEVVAMLAGEPFTDHPSCASPVVSAFLRNWNDALDDDTRQTLKQHIPRLVNSKGTPAQEERRSWMALDWLVRVQTPAWLRLAGLTEQAEILTGLGEATPETCPSIKAPLQAIRTDACAAWDAARAAAGDAAWDAARAAAWDAARATAWDALRPTTETLQESAHQLVDRMLAVTEATS